MLPHRRLVRLSRGSTVRVLLLALPSVGIDIVQGGFTAGTACVIKTIVIPLLALPSARGGAIADTVRVVTAVDTPPPFAPPGARSGLGVTGAGSRR